MSRGINQFYSRANHLIPDLVFDQANKDHNDSMKLFLDFKNLRSMSPTKLAATVSRWNDDIQYYGPAHLFVNLKASPEKRIFGDISINLISPGGNYRDPKLQITVRENLVSKSGYKEPPQVHIYKFGRSDFESFQVRDYVTDQADKFLKYKN